MQQRTLANLRHVVFSCDTGIHLSRQCSQNLAALEDHELNTEYGARTISLSIHFCYDDFLRISPLLSLLASNVRQGSHAYSGKGYEVLMWSSCLHSRAAPAQRQVMHIVNTLQDRSEPIHHVTWHTAKSCDLFAWRSCKRRLQVDLTCCSPTLTTNRRLTISNESFTLQPVPHVAHEYGAMSSPRIARMSNAGQLDL